MNEDIFCLDDLSDIKEDYRRQIESKSNLHQKITSLFNIKQELDIAMVMAGLYRKFKIETDAKTISSALSTLKKEGALNRSSRGVYAKRQHKKSSELIRNSATLNDSLDNSEAQKKPGLLKSISNLVAA